MTQPQPQGLYPPQPALDDIAHKLTMGAETLEGQARYRIDDNNSPVNQAVRGMYGVDPTEMAARQLAAARDTRLFADAVRNRSWPVQSDHDFRGHELMAHAAIHGGTVSLSKEDPGWAMNEIALDVMVARGAMTRGTPTPGGATVYTLASYGGPDGAGQRLPADAARKPQVAYVPIEQTRPAPGGPGEPVEHTSYMDLDLEENTLSIGCTKPGEPVPPAGSSAIVRYMIPGLTDQAANELMEKMLPVAQQVMEGASYESGDVNPPTGGLVLTGDRGGRPVPTDTVVVLDPTAVVAMFAIDDRCRADQFTAEQRTDLDDSGQPAAAWSQGETEQAQPAPVGATRIETMKAQLNEPQRALHDQVVASDGGTIWDGIKEADAATPDKIVVAEVLGDSGADMADELNATAAERQQAAQQFSDNAAAVQRLADAETDAAQREFLDDQADGLAHRAEKLAPATSEPDAVDEQRPPVSGLLGPFLRHEGETAGSADQSTTETRSGQDAGTATTEAEQEADEGATHRWSDPRVQERADGGWTVETMKGKYHVIDGPLGVSVYAGPDMEIVAVDEEGTLAIGGGDAKAMVEAVIEQDNADIGAAAHEAGIPAGAVEDAVAFYLTVVDAAHRTGLETSAVLAGLTTALDGLGDDLQQAADATAEAQPAADATAVEPAVEATAVEAATDATGAADQWSDPAAGHGQAADDGDYYE